MTADPRDRFSRISAFKPTRRREPLAPSSTAEAGDRLTQLLGAEIGRNRYGEHLVARQWYASPEMCAPDAGVLRLLLPPDSASRRAHAERAVAEAADPAQWLFLDTETTGLAGGTGTYAFLVGLAWWDAGGLQVEQFFMRDHAEEHSVLTEIARHLRERQRAGHVQRQIIRLAAAGNALSHDASHSRARPGGASRFAASGAATLAAASSVRCGSRNWSGVCSAPNRWAGRVNMTSTRREFRNSTSIICEAGPRSRLPASSCTTAWTCAGLAALAGRIFRTLTQPEAIEPNAETALELYGISQHPESAGRIRAGARAFTNARSRPGLPESVDLRARHELARLAKRERDFGYAAELWHGITEASRASFEACEQLCIHYERRVGRFG